MRSARSPMLRGALNPQGTDIKIAAQYALRIEPGATETVRYACRLYRQDAPFADATRIFATRQDEADAFYDQVRAGQSKEQAQIQRQALAGLLWSKQFYDYDVEKWLAAIHAGPPPPHRAQS